MNKSINLLIAKNEDVPLLKQIRILRAISLTILGIVVLSAIGLFFLILSSPLPALRSQESSASQELATLRPKSAKLYLIRERLGKIAAILNGRSQFDVIMERIINELPEGVDVEKISATDKTVAVSLTSESLFSMNSFILSMRKLQKEKKFAGITLSELTYNKNRGMYHMTLNSHL